MSCSWRKRLYASLSAKESSREVQWDVRGILLVEITLEAIKKEALNLQIQDELIKKEQLHLLLLP